MSTERSITEIFAQAVACAPGDRGSFLDDACGEDATLRAKVEQLIAVHDGQAVLDGATADLAWGTEPPTTASVRREGAGSVIGRYRLVRLIGQGGFGSVFRAEQKVPVRRSVALKIIKLGMDTEQVIARFEAERQALALMDHPSIAKVLDAGATDAGRPYFVMELVNGVPITQYCDSTHATVAQRIALFTEVCHAVQHAHQKGIIHRDIKPSNVMVALQDDEPVPKVIDFGIAKATNARLTERTLFTEDRQFIGTPEYMSPEQAEMSGLDVDTRSDIYSLGVLLYELLTGTTPFDSTTLRAGGYEAIQRTIREEEPPMPSVRLGALALEHAIEGTGPATVAAGAARRRSTDTRTLGRLVRGDLDWIVMKALDKDRTRRYETANALAADLARHLADEPVLASPPSATYRLRKLVRRHRRPVAAAVLVALLLVLGTVGTSIGMIRAVRAEAQARDRAEVTEAVTEFLNNDLLAAVAPSDERGRGRDVLMREVLEVAAERIDEASRSGGRFADRPLVEGSVRTTLGETYRLLGEYDAAEEHARRAVDVYRQVVGDKHPDTLSAILRLARVYRSQGRYDKAEPLDREVLEARQRVLGPEHRDTLLALGNLGAVHLGQDRHVEAEPLLVESMEKRQRVLGAEDPDTLMAMSQLALLYQAMARYDEAETLCLEVLETRERVFGPEDPATLGSMGSLAVVYRIQGRASEAQRLHERALGLQHRVMGPDHPHTLWTMVALADVHLLQGHLDEAEPLCFEAHDDYTRVLGAAHPATLAATQTLAAIYRAQGRAGEAADVFRTALEACREFAPSDDPDVLSLLARLADTQMAAGRDAAARRTVRELIRIRRAAAERPEASADANNVCAWLLLTCEPEELRDPAAAVRFAWRANELTGHRDPTNLDTLALAYHASGRSAKAVEIQRKALSLVPEDQPRLRDELAQRLAEFEAEEERANPVPSPPGGEG